jgi:arginine/glutamate-rich protein 1
MVSKRVEEELERRRDEIEAEVLRRVEEAKKVLEAQMLEEMEKRKQEQLEEAKRREVRILNMQIILEKQHYTISLTIPMRFQLKNRYKADANILIFRPFY